MRSIADNASVKIKFLILHTKYLTHDEKEKFLKLASDIKCDLNFLEISIATNQSIQLNRLNFPKIILPHFVKNKLYNENELTLFMLSPHILTGDIFMILKENNMADKKGGLPLFEKNYPHGDYGENTDISFLQYLSKTPFFDADMLLRIIKNFLFNRDEKIHLVRGLYNSILQAKHKVFFATEERYMNYIKENLYNKGTDKIISLKDGK